MTAFTAKLIIYTLTKYALVMWKCCVAFCHFIQTWPTCTPCCGPCLMGCRIWSRSCKSISTMRVSEEPVTSLRKMLVLHLSAFVCLSLFVHTSHPSNCQWQQRGSWLTYKKTWKVHQRETSLEYLVVVNHLFLCGCTFRCFFRNCATLTSGKLPDHQGLLHYLWGKESSI